MTEYLKLCLHNWQYNSVIYSKAKYVKNNTLYNFIQIVQTISLFFVKSVFI